MEFTSPDVAEKALAKHKETLGHRWVGWVGGKVSLPWYEVGGVGWCGGMCVTQWNF